MIFLIALLAHWIACIWHFIAIYESELYETNWLRNAGYESEIWKIRYLGSLYWSITTMVTIGYGDISPITPLEQIIGIAIMIFSSGVFGYVMSNIGQIFQNLGNVSEEYKYFLFYMLKE